MDSQSKWRSAVDFDEKSNRVIPSWSQLEDLRKPLTEGEKALIRNLDRCLPRDDSWQEGDDALADYDGWLIFVRPFLNDLRPPVVAFNPSAGAVIFEVNDWDLRRYQSEVDRESEEGANLYEQLENGDKRQVAWPQRPVEHYKKVVIEQLSPMLGEAADDGGGNYWLIKTAVYCHRAKTSVVCSKLDGGSKCTKKGERYTSLLGYDVDQWDWRELLPRSHNWDPKWTPDLLFWLNPPIHRMEQGTVLKLRGNQVKLAEPTPGHFRIRGVAGSGKTQALAYRAAKLASQEKRVLILTFNITLWHYIKDMVARAPFTFSWEQITFDHFHGFCWRFLPWESRPNTRNEENRKRYYEEIVPQMVARVIERHEREVEKYDAILIDEGQDYVYNWYDLLNTYFLSKRDEVVVCCDKRQNIYRRDLSWLDKRVTRRGLEKFGDYIDLTVSIRQPPKLAAFAKAFADRFALRSDIPQVARRKFPDELISTEHIGWLELSPSDAKPDAAVVTTIWKQVQALVKSGQKPSDIVILVPTHKMGVEVLERFRKEQVRVNHVIDVGEGHRSNKKAFWMEDARLKLCTIHSFKGWELQNVILVTPLETEAGWSNIDSLVYTALTRVKRTIIVLNRNPRYSTFAKAARAAASAPSVTQWRATTNNKEVEAQGDGIPSVSRSQAGGNRPKYEF
ncbi:MAG: UvrD-helicase domain-containing protein [Kiritimatiellia bacterium]